MILSTNLWFEIEAAIRQKSVLSRCQCSTAWIDPIFAWFFRYFSRTRRFLCFSSQRASGAWEWIWSAPTAWSCTTQTGTRARTHKPGRGPGGLGRRATWPSTACWPAARSRRKSITGEGALTGAKLHFTPNAIYHRFWLAPSRYQ